jgi:hypothetical protein
MQAMHIDLQRISLGALIISLSLLVDSAMTAIDVMTTRLAQGDSKEEAASFAYKTLALPMLTGTFVTIAGFVPIGFARSAAGEYTFSIFAVVTIALIVSWFVAVLFAPLLGVWILKSRTSLPMLRQLHLACVPFDPRRRDASALAHNRGDARLLRRRPAAATCRGSSSRLRQPGARCRLTAAAKRLDLWQRSCVNQLDAAGRRSRRRQLEHLCRTRRDRTFRSTSSCRTTSSRKSSYRQRRCSARPLRKLEERWRSSCQARLCGCRRSSLDPSAGRCNTG